MSLPCPPILQCHLSTGDIMEVQGTDLVLGRHLRQHLSLALEVRTSRLHIFMDGSTVSDDFELAWLIHPRVDVMIAPLTDIILREPTADHDCSDILPLCCALGDASISVRFFEIHTCGCINLRVWSHSHFWWQYECECHADVVVVVENYECQDLGLVCCPICNIVFFLRSGAVILVTCQVSHLGESKFYYDFR